MLVFNSNLFNMSATLVFLVVSDIHSEHFIPVQKHTHLKEGS